MQSKCSAFDIKVLSPELRYVWWERRKEGSIEQGLLPDGIWEFEERDGVQVKMILIL